MAKTALMLSHGQVTRTTPELVPYSSKLLTPPVQINLEVYSDDVQELLDSRYQKLTVDELVEMQEQDIEEHESTSDYTATSAELGNIHTALLAAKERMNLPLFRLPISIEALDALIKKVEEQRAHLTPVDSTPKETVPSDTTLNSPSKRTLKNLRLKTDKKRLIDDDGFQTPDKRHTAKRIAPPPPAESSDSEIEDEDAGKSNPTAADRQLAPTLISKLTGKFLRIAVQSDDEYRKLAQFLRHEGVEYKSFLLKSDRPLKLLIRGLPTSTKVEEILVEIEREGFQIHKISRLQKFKTKAPMPLIYLQLVNDAKADTIFQFTEMFGTQISFERYDNSRNKKPNQCWRCQGFSPFFGSLPSPN
ncbi:RNA-directed DNA polymerase from mobile element jockey [Trichonephila clavipes]|nr:RNA-directed DNA polymerase from mobile element jockey [Trichonephila clavipes]